jgi:predicted amidohydrolase
MKRLRVAALQYYIRPVDSAEQFRDQVTALVETAVDYEAQLVLFPEYFTIQRFESEDWDVHARDRLRIFDTAFGKVAITICYDVEFPEIARAAAWAGAHILLVPSCTDERQGFLRVRYCAHARAIENQMYVIVSHTVGSLPMVPAVSLNYGQAAILTPSDFAFSRDGILAEGHPNQEMMVIGDLNLETILQARTTGTVLPLNDSRNTAKILERIEELTL